MYPYAKYTGTQGDDMNFSVFRKYSTVVYFVEGLYILPTLTKMHECELYIDIMQQSMKSLTLLRRIAGQEKEWNVCDNCRWY